MHTQHFSKCAPENRSTRGIGTVWRGEKIFHGQINYGNAVLKKIKLVFSRVHLKW